MEHTYNKEKFISEIQFNWGSYIFLCLICQPLIKWKKSLSLASILSSLLLTLSLMIIFLKNIYYSHALMKTKPLLNSSFPIKLLKNSITPKATHNQVLTHSWIHIIYHRSQATCSLYHTGLFLHCLNSCTVCTMWFPLIFKKKFKY